MRTNDKICVGEYCYRFSRASVNGFAKEYRCCDERCCARVLFNSSEEIKLVGDHNMCTFDHETELRSRRRRQLACDMLAKNITDPPRRIIERMEVLMKLTPEEKKSLKSFISRKQAAVLGSTQTSDDFVVPQHLKVVLHQSPDVQDDTFLLYDSIDDTSETRSRILIFSSVDMRFKASLATELFADGTYKIAPDGFVTLYTIHTLIDEIPYPIFFFLLKDEREETFVRALTVIRPFLLRFEGVGVVHVDCQRSAINAFKKTFNCTVRLCLFHVNQALWRMVVKCGLARDYNDVSKPRLHAWLRRLMSFPFLKKERMVGCFSEYFEALPFDETHGVEQECREKFRSVVTYYKRFWIDEIGPAMLCQYNEHNRTNNHSEAFHRAVGLLVQVAHPQPLVLIRMLIDVEDESRRRFIDQRSGKNASAKDKRLVDLERLIAETMQSYEKGLFRNDLEFLNSIARLYVEYNHKLKSIRLRNNVRFQRYSRRMKQRVFSILNEQETNRFSDETDDDVAQQDYVEPDYNSEILFDAQTHMEDVSAIQPIQQKSRRLSESEQHKPKRQKRSCAEGRKGTSRQQDKKPRAEKTTRERQQRPPKKRTLLQRMNKVIHGLK